MAAAVAVVALAGCGGGDGELGGSAEVVQLAATDLGAAPSGPLVWLAEEHRLEPGEELEHAHELAFVYARRGTNELGSDALAVGDGAAVRAGASHVHRAGGEAGSTFWEIRLAPADAALERGSRLVFRSEPLEGVPPRARASFLLVRIPPGGETSVHTHPGPELIYQLTGRILYQNGLIGTLELGPGGLEGIPPATAVQKRNRFDADAEFLSWFLVDPEEPFAPGAAFPTE